MIQNIPISSIDSLDNIGLFTRKPTQVEKIAFPRDQRKRRKNNRRAFAAGDKTAFTK
jgi:hypothetical protein